MRKWLSAALVAVLVLLSFPVIAADCSGTIASGNTAQTVFTSSNVRSLMVMNNSAHLMCIAWNGAVAAIAGTNCDAASWALAPGSATVAGGSLIFPQNIVISTLSVIASGTGDRYSCERQ